MIFLPLSSQQKIQKGFPMEFLFAYQNLLSEHVSKKKLHMVNHYRSIFAHVFSPMLTNEKDGWPYPCMLHVWYICYLHLAEKNSRINFLVNIPVPKKGALERNWTLPGTPDGLNPREKTLTDGAPTWFQVLETWNLTQYLFYGCFFP